MSANLFSYAEICRCLVRTKMARPMQLTSIAAVLLLSGAAHAANDLNSVILRTTEQMERELGGRNYDINSSFTEDLHYGDACCIPATNGGKTMCVAAVAEVLIRTLNEVGKEVSEVFVKFPISHWKQSKYLNIRPHLYQFKGVQSRGPGDALSRFGIGEIVPFDRMLGGDVLAFSRLNGSGHIRASFANAGRLWSPERWTVDASIAALKTRFVRNASRGGAISTDRIKELLDADIAPVYGVDFKE